MAKGDRDRDYLDEYRRWVDIILGRRRSKNLERRKPMAVKFEGSEIVICCDNIGHGENRPPAEVEVEVPSVSGDTFIAQLCQACADRHQGIEEAAPVGAPDPEAPPEEA